MDLALSFDNLGEAADLERGLWPAGEPLGRHASVVEVLPRLLDELDVLGLRATFCLEALNCEMYPDAVREIAARGHEVALHGWRHEAWSSLDPAREDALLARGREAFGALGLDVRGFRPPGGDVTADSAERLVAHGFAWCSPAGGRRTRAGAIAWVPFDWTLVDAYWRLDSFADRRGARGDPVGALGPGAAADVVLHHLDAGAAPTLVLHPFLMADADGWEAGRRVLRRARDLAAGGAARVAPVGHIAAAL